MGCEFIEFLLVWARLALRCITPHWRYPSLHKGKDAVRKEEQ